MLSIHADGDGRHRLEDARGTAIGWVRGRTIGFTGLRSVRGAIGAAADGARALQQALRRQYPGWPQHVPALEELRVVHDGAHEWISDGKVPLVRLLRLRGEEATRGAFGLEFVLPTFASDGVAIAVAHALGRAMLASLASPDRAPVPTTFTDSRQAQPGATPA